MSSMSSTGSTPAPARPIASASDLTVSPPSATACRTVPGAASSSAMRNSGAASSRLTAGQRCVPSPTYADTPVFCAAAKSRPALSARDCRTVVAWCWPEGTWTAFPTRYGCCAATASRGLGLRGTGQGAPDDDPPCRSQLPSPSSPGWPSAAAAIPATTRAHGRAKCARPLWHGAAEQARRGRLAPFARIRRTVHGGWLS
jgi:hypothetical protein